MNPPSASVIVLNCNGREHLAPCFQSLLALDYPRSQLDLVLADNGSTDGSRERTARHYPQVRILTFERNLGFAAGYNRAVAACTSDLVVLLNNDTRVESGWLRALVACWQRHDPACAAVGGALLSWDGRSIDFGGARLNFHGFGFSDGLGQPYRPGALGAERAVPFGCGGALLVERAAWIEAGGLDEDYFAYFEDVDFGWRLWLLGREVWFAPDAVAYHRGHGTGMPSAERAQRLERNALHSIVKNFEQPTLDRVLPAALQLAVRRATLDAAGPVAALKPAGTPPREIRSGHLAPLLAVDGLAAEWPALLERRARVQATRRRSDVELFARFGGAWLAPARVEPAYLTSHQQVVAAHGLDQLVPAAGSSTPPSAMQGLGAPSTGSALAAATSSQSRASARRSQPLHGALGEMAGSPHAELVRSQVGGSRPKVLIVGHDVIGPKMAGPALRQWELARVLAAHVDVTLAAPGTPDREPEGFRLAGYRRGDATSLAGEIAGAGVIFTYLALLRELPTLATAGKPLVLDLVTPHLLESLEQWASSARPIGEQQEELDSMIAALGGQLRAGDFFVAGNERQRRFWLGALTAAGRVNPSTFEDDTALRRLIDVVPFGLPAAPPVHRTRVLKGVHPGIGQHDRVILWGSGIWNWFDPLTLIRAVMQVVASRPEVKLFFIARTHFDTTVVPEQAMAGRAAELARELGLLDRHVFFGDWVAYDERENFLLEADIGVSLHFEHVETHFAARTRLWDMLWAGLPLLVTRGDELGDRVEREGLGRAVAAEDVAGVAEAIVELLDTPELKTQLAPSFARVQAEFAWERVAAPLVAFCRAPHFAADADLRASEAPGTGLLAVPPPWWRLPLRAVEYARAGGPRYLWQGVRLYARWLRERFGVRS